MLELLALMTAWRYEDRLRPVFPEQSTVGLRPAYREQSIPGLRSAFPEQRVAGLRPANPKRRIPGNNPGLAVAAATAAKRT